MKYVNIFIPFFLVCLANVNSDPQVHQKRSIDPYSITIDSIMTVPNGSQFFLRIFTRLLNNTNDTLKYWELNCGPKYALYQIDYDRITWADGVKCLSTFPGQYVLAPHASRFDTLLIKRISSNKNAIKFRLGCYIF